MPCSSPPDYRDDHGNLKNGENPQALLDKLTRLLCEASTVLEARGEFNHNDLSPELQAWWTEHKAWDAKRRANDRGRR